MVAKLLKLLLPCIYKQKPAVFELKNIKSQTFSLPHPLIIYILKVNPFDSVSFPYKLLRCCKYFYFKTEYFQVFNLLIHESDVPAASVSLDSLKFLNLKIRFECLFSIDVEEEHPLLASSWLPHICGPFYSCTLAHQKLTVTEYQLLTQNLTVIRLREVKIFDANESEIFLDKIITFGPKLNDFN